MAFHEYSESPTRRDTVRPGHGARPHGALYRNGLKRGLDIVLVLVTLPVTLPVILGLMALAALDGHPPLFRQQRLGRNGRIFHMLKIRTMVPGADALLERHLAADAEARREWDETQKLKSDPRVTRIGRVLRKCSLDELTQLWNVLTGDMSLVGPRPMMVDQEDIYPGRAYFDLRPGITGLWQISERNDSSFAARAMFDTRYLADLSLSLDVAILLRTVVVVVRGTGY